MVINQFNSCETKKIKGKIMPPEMDDMADAAGELQLMRIRSP